MGHFIPIPSESDQITWTAPLLTTPTCMNSRRASNRLGQVNMDPNLLNFSLDVPSGSCPPPALYNSADSIAHLYNNNGPWSTHLMRNSSKNTKPDTVVFPDVPGFGVYCERHESDVDGIACRSDSGYQTQPAGSVVSSKPDHTDQEVSPGTTPQVGSMNVDSSPNEPPDVVLTPSDQRSQYSSRGGNHGKQLECPDCGDKSKCNSDYKCVPRITYGTLDS